MDTFYITSESRVLSPPFRRSRSRGALAVEPIINTVPTKAEKQRRARSKSRPRALYAADPDIVKVPPGKQIFFFKWTLECCKIAYFVIIWFRLYGFGRHERRSDSRANQRNEEDVLSSVGASSGRRFAARQKISLELGVSFYTIIRLLYYVFDVRRRLEFITYLVFAQTIKGGIGYIKNFTRVISSSTRSSWEFV